VSDLGLLVDSRLSFNLHISNIVTKATRRSGVFFRGFASRQLALVEKTFITYIRPLLEFNSNICNPTKKYLIDKLENIQRRFKKKISSISHLSYLERLSVLDLQPLELRRLHFDLIQYYKILNNLTALLPDSYFHFNYPPFSARKPFPYLSKPPNFNNCLLSSFFHRNIDCWNSLPELVKRSSSLNQFKQKIKCIDFRTFLKGGAFNSFNLQ
jgi:hypothetical protein